MRTIGKAEERMTYMSRDICQYERRETKKEEKLKAHTFIHGPI